MGAIEMQWDNDLLSMNLFRGEVWECMEAHIDEEVPRGNAGAEPHVGIHPLIRNGRRRPEWRMGRKLGRIDEELYQNVANLRS
eukprot:jgi/Psemu1/53371/gm1.53371_g